MQEINYITGTPNCVSVDSPRFEELCKSGCKVYNKKWCCPPCSKGFLINQWLPFHVVILWMNNNIESNNEYTKVKAINSILKSKLYKLLRQYPNKDVLGSGSCRLCKKCNYPNPCKHPNKMISSCEAFGIDVEAMSKNLGHELYWYKKGEKYKYGTVVGLIRNSNKDKIESQLLEILNGKPMVKQEIRIMTAKAI